MINQLLKYGLVVIVIMAISCGESKVDRIKRLVDVKVEKERLRLESDCRSELLAKALEQVDSVIIARALQDTSVRLVRPIRPDVPSLAIPDIDTLGVKPLFE